MVVTNSYLQQIASHGAEREQALLYTLAKEIQNVMKRNAWVLLSLMAVVMMLAAACSLNRQLPKEADEEAMVVEVRSAIAAAVPGKTFAIDVDVTQGGHVTLSGHVNNQNDKDAIVSKVRQVNGITSVDASGIHIQ